MSHLLLPIPATSYHCLGCWCHWHDCHLATYLFLLLLCSIMPLHQSSSFDYFTRVRTWLSQSFGPCHKLNHGPTRLSNTFIWPTQTELVRLFHLRLRPFFNDLRYIFLVSDESEHKYICWIFCDLIMFFRSTNYLIVIFDYRIDITLYWIDWSMSDLNFENFCMLLMSY